MSVDMDDVSYVARSTYRARVLLTLHVDGPSTPSSIASDTGIAITHVSRSLADLRGEGYVDLLVDEETRKGRYYGATDHGGETAENIIGLGEVPE